MMMIMVKMRIHRGFRVYCLFSTLVKYIFNKSREQNNYGKYSTWHHLGQNTALVVLYYTNSSSPSFPPSPSNHTKEVPAGSLHVFNLLWWQPNMSFLHCSKTYCSQKPPIIILDLHQLWAPIWASSLANRPNRPNQLHGLGHPPIPPSPSPPKLCGGFVSSCSLYHHPSGVFQLSCSPTQNA
jgi:hypothetical protein